MRALIVMFAVAVVLAAQAHAQPAAQRPARGMPSLLPSGEDLARMPDAQVTRGPDGQIQTVELNRNGVVIRATRESGEFATVGVDTTGVGVMCTWALTRMIRAAVRLCGSPEHAALRQVLDHGVAATDAFILQNSLVPVPADAWAETIAHQEEEARMVMLEPSGAPNLQRCERFFAQTNIASLGPNAPNFFRDLFNRVLAVPRPPVTNPCL